MGQQWRLRNTQTGEMKGGYNSPDFARMMANAWNESGRMTLPEEVATPEQAGFDSEEEAMQAHAERGLKEHGETLDEFLNRVHCQGLGGRNTFSIR